MALDYYIIVNGSDRSFNYFTTMTSHSQ